MVHPSTPTSRSERLDELHRRPGPSHRAAGFSRASTESAKLLGPTASSHAISRTGMATLGGMWSLSLIVAVFSAGLIVNPMGTAAVVEKAKPTAILAAVTGKTPAPTDSATPEETASKALTELNSTDIAEESAVVLAAAAADATPDSATEAATADPASVTFAPQPARHNEHGVSHSDTPATGVWQVAGDWEQPLPGRGQTLRYVLRTEDGTFVDADKIARFVFETLNDERSWGPSRHVDFQQVSDPALANFTISIATPATTDELCAPLDTAGTWSCHNGSTVNINADRWNYLVPWVPDAVAYRQYLVNHEVGHWLGYQHETCRAAGLAAPVMMQQSMGLGECTANPWPAFDHLSE